MRNALASGYEYFTDVIDGYSFLYPADWVQVRVRTPACAQLLRRCKP
jgi:hypothetical protein